MRVVITGGTGLIGSALAKSLVQEGHDVVVLSRNPQKHQNDLPAGVRAAAWDGVSSEGWLKEADGADAIVNLAGENLSGGRWTKKRKERIVNSRLNAGKAVSEAVAKAVYKPGVVIQASGINYYGPHGDEKVTEKTHVGKDFLARLCVDWESSTASVEAEGVRRAVVRMGVVLSQDGGALRLMALPYRFFVGGPLGRGNQYVSWVHLEDVVKAIEFLISNPNGRGVFNLTAPNPLTNRGFGKTLAGVLHRPNRFKVPAPMMRLVLGELATVVLDGQRAMPQRLLDLGYKYCYPQAAAALEEIYGIDKASQDGDQ